MNQSIEIPLAKIDPNPFQPRAEFPEKEQRELMESIAKNGLIQPIVVRQYKDRYQILAGERRYKAFQDLGFPTIPAMVREFTDEEMHVLSIIENVQREELSAIEVARGYQALINDLGYTQERISAQLGKERSTVANTLRLLELPIEIQQDISKKTLSSGHARALLPLKESAQIFVLRELILRNKWSVREVEKKVRSLLKKPGGSKVSAKPTKDANVRNLEAQLSLHLGTRVEIWGENEGSIQIVFGSVTEFNRIFNAIMEKEGSDDEDE